MNISPSATRLLKAFEEWLEASSKKDYRFTLEEEARLDKMIQVMNNHLDMLIDYETKRQQELEKEQEN